MDRNIIEENNKVNDNDDLLSNKTSDNQFYQKETVYKSPSPSQCSIYWDW